MDSNNNPFGGGPAHTGAYSDPNYNYNNSNNMANPFDSMGMAAPQGQGPPPGQHPYQLHEQQQQHGYMQQPPPPYGMMKSDGSLDGSAGSAGAHPFAGAPVNNNNGPYNVQYQQAYSAQPSMSYQPPADPYASALVPTGQQGNQWGIGPPPPAAGPNFDPFAPPPPQPPPPQQQQSYPPQNPYESNPYGAPPPQPYYSQQPPQPPPQNYSQPPPQQQQQQPMQEDPNDPFGLGGGVGALAVAQPPPPQDVPQNITTSQQSVASEPPPRRFSSDDDSGYGQQKSVVSHGNAQREQQIVARRADPGPSSRRPRHNDDDASGESPPRNKYSDVLAQRAPPGASPLPRADLVRKRGFVLSRISFRTIVMKKWKQSYWVQYGPHTMLWFRSQSDFDDWLNNPYHDQSQRNFLIKLAVNFVHDLYKPNVRGYQVTQCRTKAYGKKMVRQFKLERWMDYGPTIAAAFGSYNPKEVDDLREALVECMRNTPLNGGIRATGAVRQQAERSGSSGDEGDDEDDEDGASTDDRDRSHDRDYRSGESRSNDPDYRSGESRSNDYRSGESGYSYDTRSKSTNEQQMHQTSAEDESVAEEADLLDVNNWDDVPSQQQQHVLPPYSNPAYMGGYPAQTQQVSGQQQGYHQQQMVPLGAPQAYPGAPPMPQTQQQPYYQQQPGYPQQQPQQQAYQQQPSSYQQQPADPWGQPAPNQQQQAYYSSQPPQGYNMGM